MRYYFIFCKTDLVLQKLGDGKYTIPKSDDSPILLHDWQHVHNITPMDDGTEVKTVMLDDPAQLNERVASFKDAVFEFCPLRKSYYKLSRDLYLKAGKCQEILYWDHNTQYCGVCGSPMKMHTDISKRCPNCGKEVWPELATAIIVLIHKGNEVLLVHARNFKGDFYGLVAGFVETGETLEEAVHREVMEETGLTITNLKYFGSQPWPYPCGLMVIRLMMLPEIYIYNAQNCLKAIGLHVTISLQYQRNCPLPASCLTTGLTRQRQIKKKRNKRIK